MPWALQVARRSSNHHLLANAYCDTYNINSCSSTSIVGCFKSWKMSSDNDECVNMLEKFLRANQCDVSRFQPEFIEDLLHRSLYLRQRYGDRKAERIRRRMEPFLTSLQSFSEVIKVFLQASPAFVTLLWGSVFFVLEVGVHQVVRKESMKTARSNSEILVPAKSKV